MFNSDLVKAEVKKLQAKNPKRSFKSCWEQLQRDRPGLFEEGTHGTGVSNDRPPQVFKYASTNVAIGDPKKRIVDTAPQFSLADAITELMKQPKMVQAEHQPVLIRGNEWNWSTQ